jgi:hypothetical protein
MEKDTEKTKVIFRKFKDGEIVALFPEIFTDTDEHNTNLIASYLQVGQHGDAEYNHVLGFTKLATPAEYQDLARELESIGYNLDIRQRK